MPVWLPLTDDELALLAPTDLLLAQQVSRLPEKTRGLVLEAIDRHPERDDMEILDGLIVENAFIDREWDDRTIGWLRKNAGVAVPEGS